MRNGFTLIEMAIVLVIIGLIVGGVLVGQDLIKTAAVRAQISQIEKYQTAVNTFYGKYGYLPGDINATAAAAFGFFPRGSNAGQGDGNGVIQGCSGVNIAGETVLCGEIEMFWVDLSQVGLIDGGFSQTSYMTTFPFNVSQSQIGLFMPEAKIGGGNYVYVWSGGWQMFANNQDNTNYFGLSAVIGEIGNGSVASNVTLTVKQAYNIDTKIDDGMPQSGRVMALYPGADAFWAVGGANGAVNGSGSSKYGDYDQGTRGPITSQTGSNAYYADGNGSLSTDLCYDNGDTLQPEHYSVEINNGAGPNCALSFAFQ